MEGSNQLTAVVEVAMVVGVHREGMEECGEVRSGRVEGQEG